MLAVLSEGFRNWKANLNVIEHVVSELSVPTPALGSSCSTKGNAKILPAYSRLQDASPSRDSGYSSTTSRSPTRSPRHGDDGLGEDATNDPSLVNPNTDHPGPHMFFVEHSQHFNQSDFGILFPYITRRLAKAEEPERILELNTRAMVQLIRNAGIEVGVQDDTEILSTNTDIRSWKPIPFEEPNKGHTGSQTHDAVE